MERSVLNAYSYMFKSKNWLLKFIILSLFNLPTAYYVSLYFENKLNPQTPEFYLLTVISAIATLVTYGYSACCSRNLLYLDFDNPNILPTWNGFVTDYLIIGLKKCYYNAMVYLFMIPYSWFSFKTWMTPEAGIDVALDGIFCENFEYQRCPDLGEMLDTIRDSLGTYYSLAIACFAPIFVALILGMILMMNGFKVPDIWAFAPFVFAYYLLVSAYCAGASAQYTKTSAF